MKCLWCDQPTDDGLVYHSQCWRARDEAENRKACELMHEAHDTIKAARRGENVNPSAACLARYGDQIRYSVELGRGRLNEPEPDLFNGAHTPGAS